ncbi:MAG: hypothetical protein WBA74_21555, partial [Cyclobacteriaceae bacterium]
CVDKTGTLIITADGGSGNYVYKLDDGEFVPNNTFAKVAAGEHEVEVRDGDCSANRNVTVAIDPKLSDDIMPIINTKCATSGCHKESIYPYLDDKNFIITNASWLGFTIIDGYMPPSESPQLTDDEISTISCWVENGAPDN